MEEEKGRVCVTGAGGFLGSWLVKLLLSKGYKVHGTARDPGDPEKSSHLKSLEKAQENLQLFKADLLDYGSLCAAIAGCVGVFHVACPVPTSRTINNPELEMLEPAITGTLNVLKACSEAGTVERAVVVSSTAAVMMNPEWPPNRAMDEDCWTDVDYCRKILQKSQTLQQEGEDQSGSAWTVTQKAQWFGWYCIAKTTSEREALKYGEKTGLHVITACPSLVFGPLLQPNVNFSTQCLIDLLGGKFETWESMHWTIVDVRDAARAFLLLYEKKEAVGRYICGTQSIEIQNLVAMLKNMYPNFSYPKNFLEVSEQAKQSSEKLKSLGWTCRSSAEKLKRLGWTCRSLDEIIYDSVEYYQNVGILKTFS